MDASIDISTHPSIHACMHACKGNSLCVHAALAATGNARVPCHSNGASLSMLMLHAAAAECGHGTWEHKEGDKPAQQVGVHPSSAGRCALQLSRKVYTPAQKAGSLQLNSCVCTPALQEGV
eukprot:556853-Pelagomonas_calceolata.AAC.1